LTPINESNKGFQMLVKMGYKKGTGLGKESTGIQEPLALLIKEDRSGIGNKRDQLETERIDPKKRKLEDAKKEELFKSSSKEKGDTKKSIKTMTKIITQICPQLDEQKKNYLKSTTPKIRTNDQINPKPYMFPLFTNHGRKIRPLR